MEARPEIVAGGIGVPDDGVCPLERSPLSSVETVDVNLGGIRQVAEAELLHRLVDNAGTQDAVGNESPRLGGILMQRKGIIDVRQLGHLPRGEPRTRFGGQLLVTDAPGLDYPLLAERDRDERAEFDDLFLVEVAAKPCPYVVVDPIRVPDQVTRVQERGLLPVRESVGALKVEQVAVVALRQLVSRTERPLCASVLAPDGFGDVDAT